MILFAKSITNSEEEANILFNMENNTFVQYHDKFIESSAC